MSPKRQNKFSSHLQHLPGLLSFFFFDIRWWIFPGGFSLKILLTESTTVSVKTTSTKIHLTKSNTISGDFFFMEYRTVRIYRKGKKNLPSLICFPLCSFYRVRPFIFLSITGMSICQKHKEISLKILFV